MGRFVHRSVAIAVMVAFLAGSLAFGGKTASAQGTSAPGVWQSSINLQNVGTTAATVQIDFYDANGQKLGASYSSTEPIAAGGALSVFVPAQVEGLAAGQYSAVVNSTAEIKATVNTASTNAAQGPWTAFGYEGIGAGDAGTTLYFPGLYKSYFGFNSEMVIQNAGTDGNATLTARFFNTQGQQIATANLGSVAPNASRTISVGTLTATPALPTGSSGLFSAVVTSNEGKALAGVANIWRLSPTNGTSSYNAFTGGGSTLYAPALYKSYYGFVSALTVQNIGAQAANVTITYGNGTTETFTLQPNAAREYYQPNNAALPSGNTNGVFSAKVTSTTTGANLVGLVSLGHTQGKGDLGSYNVPDEAANQVNVPNVLSDYYGYFTAVTVQNTCSSATNVTITYGTGQSRTFTNVPANGTVNILHLGGDDVLPNQTSTSAVVSASNAACQLVAVLQHGTAPGVQGYNPNKVPSDYLLALTGSAK